MKERKKSSNYFDRKSSRIKVLDLAPNTVKLILRNNIDVRKNKTSNKTSDKTSSEVLFDGLSEDENILLVVYIKLYKEVTR